MAAPQALTPEQIQQIIAAGQGGSVNIGGTIYQPQFAQLGGGEGGSLGGLENIYGYTPEQNKVGGTYNQYDPTGAFVQQGVTKKDQSFFGGLVDAFKDPVVLAALGGAGYAGLLGGGGAAGLTASELAAADMALGGAGGTAGYRTAGGRAFPVARKTARLD